MLWLLSHGRLPNLEALSFHRTPGASAKEGVIAAAERGALDKCESIYLQGVEFADAGQCCNMLLAAVKLPQLRRLELRSCRELLADVLLVLFGVLLVGMQEREQEDDESSVYSQFAAIIAPLVAGTAHALETLAFQACGISDVTGLVNIFNRNAMPRLASLDLRHNTSLDDDGFLMLMSILSPETPPAPALATLRLEGTGITDEGAEALLEFWTQHRARTLPNLRLLGLPTSISQAVREQLAQRAAASGGVLEFVYG